MFDYSKQIDEFRDKKVRLEEKFKEKLYSHRGTNRKRLVDNLPNEVPNVRISGGSFKPQGSMPMGTIIQTKFASEEYDIDDGVVLWKDDLVDSQGEELSAAAAKEKVRKALKSHLFKRQPRICTNCVRVFYAEEDKEKHHVDFPVYRKFRNEDDEIERELASAEDWVPSDPTQVNVWFEKTIEDRNKATKDKGTQLRQLIQLLKRFCRSRKGWDLPNGMKLTMLAVECQPRYSTRIDRAFLGLLEKLEERLEDSKVILNLAHPDKPAITRTDEDDNVCNLLDKTREALDEHLVVLDEADCTQDKARSAWDWVFKSDGLFAEQDAELSASGSKSGDGPSIIAPSTPPRPVVPEGGGKFG